MINLILCGGSGTRLWPLSREEFPKQFCKLIGNFSLFQGTLLRNKNYCQKTIIFTNTKHFKIAKEQIDNLVNNGLHKNNNIKFFLEPTGRNTAPAITIACLTLNENDIVFVTPSDHYIIQDNNYKEILERANILAEEGYIVTFGIKPTQIETGFGYIKADNENVISFHEKPNFETAKKYFESGNFFWNSGMFVFKAGVFLEEIKKYSNNIYEASKTAFENSEKNAETVAINKNLMEKIPAVSIDYAVMEKSKKIKMVSSNINWSDIGSFESLYEFYNRDDNGNASLKENIIFNSKNNLIISDKKVTIIDIDDLIIAETADELLISKKGSSQKIKDVRESKK